MARIKTIVNTSVILLAKINTPGMITQDYLIAKEIVPKQFEVKNEVTTPLLSRVQYKNGYLLEAQPNRLKFELNYLTPNVNITQDFSIDDSLSEMVESFVFDNRHVNFLAIGINFQLFVKQAQLSKVSKGLPGKVQTVGLTYTLNHSGFKIQMTMNDGSIQNQGDEVQGTLVNANFHTTLPKMPIEARLNQIKNLLKKRNACLIKLEGLIDETKF